MSVREAVAATIARGDLEHNPLIETGADRIGALAFSDSLGAAMLRITADHDRGAWDVAVGLLSKRVASKRRRENPSMIRKLCTAVLKEWLDDKCRKCMGRGFLMAIGSTKSACTLCGGNSIRRHSDAERCRAMGFDRSVYPKWEARFGEAHDILSAADTRMSRKLATQLSRNQ